MRAVVMRNHELVVDDVPVPTPGPGEVLVKTLTCGICGTDLHALRYAQSLAKGDRCAGGLFALDPGCDLVMGHEFCAEIVEYGPGTRKRFKPGTRVCSMPVLTRGTGVASIGYSNEHPGGFAEMMRLTEDNLVAVPNHVSSELAALTEPLAVGYHAVARARLARREVALVVGCGPLGLAVIAALKQRGDVPIVAADLSPGRRELAVKLGADIVIDPREKSPYASFEAFETAGSHGRNGNSAPASANGMINRPSVLERVRRKCSRVRSRWFGFQPKVIFECVGRPGVLDEIMFHAPRHARILVLGLCMERDYIHGLSAIQKELNVQFLLGYTREEFAATLRGISRGQPAIQSLITGKVGLDGVARAFSELGTPGSHGKILIEPWRD